MKLTIDDYRKQYRDATGQDPAIRWNKNKIQKEIVLFKAEKEFEKSQNASKEPANITESKPEFEAAIDSNQNKSPFLEGTSNVDSADIPDRRGGFREGAGRPIGQTDKRARCERLLSLEKPDLAILKILQGLNLPLAKFTPVPFTPEQIESIALGITLPLYYWFPSLENRADVLTLHLQALEYVAVPFAARTITLKQIQKEKEDVEKNKADQKAGSAVGSAGITEASVQSGFAGNAGAAGSNTGAAAGSGAQAAYSRTGTKNKTVRGRSSQKHRR
jgi:hypothetical protein